MRSRCASLKWQAGDGSLAENRVPTGPRGRLRSRMKGRVISARAWETMTAAQAPWMMPAAPSSGQTGRVLTSRRPRRSRSSWLQQRPVPEDVPDRPPDHKQGAASQGETADGELKRAGSGMQAGLHARRGDVDQEQVELSQDGNAAHRITVPLAP